MFRFHKGYFVVTILLFLTEVLIALYVKDTIIRPYFGDFLVVILIYTFLKTFLNAPVPKLAVAVLAFAFVVEITQYFKLVNRLGLQHSTIAKLVLGTSFAWLDLLNYTLGIFAVLLIERWRHRDQVSLQ